MRALKVVVAALGVLAVVLVVLWFLGPREPADLTVRFDPARIGDDPDAYLAAEEARFADLRDGQGKGVVHAFPNSRATTPVALVYLHGFSASRGEISPVVENVSKALGANVVFARLAGHGLDGAAMGEVTVNDWVNDVAEALTIAERLGERTVVIGTSTGATLGAMAALHPDLRGRIDALVQISPNYALKDRRALVLDFPFAERIVRIIEGEERGFEPVTALHGERWTTRYPTRAVVTMAALTRAVRAMTFENAAVPTLFMFDEEDRVVDHAVTRRVAERWGRATGALVNIELIEGTDDPYRHVIAGDALSPSTSGRVSSIIASWVEQLPLFTRPVGTVVSDNGAGGGEGTVPAGASDGTAR